MSASNPQPRFPLVDALRGVAAASVVAYHIYLQDLLPHARAPFPGPLHAVLARGYLGVYIFFILSGFVIAHSLRGIAITPSFIGRFALRRSVRLDPPYWITIAAAIGVALIWTPGSANPTSGVPSVRGVVAHVFYAQQFLGIPHLVGVFWTLCLEIQFYLAYVVLVFVAQRLARGRLWLVLGPLWLGSLVVTTGGVDVGHALFLWAWPYFFLGVVTAWQLEGRLSSRAWGLVTGATCVVLLWSHSRWLTAVDAPERTGIAAATTACLFLAARARRAGGTWLQTATLGRPLQYLGRISYSWYLTHALVGWAGARLGIRLLGDGALGAGEMAALVLGCMALSVAGAHVLHVLVERPAHALSRRIKLQASAPAPPRDGSAADPAPAPAA